MSICSSGAINLVNGIATQAVEDYRSLRKQLKKDPSNPYLLGKLREIENFFMSKWFKTLTDANGEYILAKLRKEKC